MIPRELQIGATLPAALPALHGAAHPMSALANFLGEHFMLRRLKQTIAAAPGRAPAWVVLALFGLTSAACMVGPKYKTPTAPVPTAYKEAPPASFKEGDGWKTA